MRKYLLAASILALLPFTSFAANSTKASAPPALTAPLQAGFKIESSFDAVSGLKGWVVKAPNGQYNVFFSTADGETLIAGTLVNSTGANLTQSYSEQYIPKPDVGAIWDKLEKSSFIIEGEAKNPKSVIYAILDPNCGFCHYLWLALQPYEAAGLQVRWVPVAILGEPSKARAAALLEGGAKALAEQQTKYNHEDAPKGIAANPITEAQLEGNLAIMQEAQINGTPGIFYKDASGKVVAKSGFPPLKELPAITGLPEQKQTSEMLLKRFGQN